MQGDQDGQWFGPLRLRRNWARAGRLSAGPVLAMICVAPAPAAERAIGLTSFDRVRLEGPFAVEIRTGLGPGGRITGDPAALERIDLSVTGTTLVIRSDANGWGERPNAGAKTPVKLVLTTPALSTAVLSGGGTLSIDTMKAARVDLTLNGAGALSIGKLETAALSATLAGAGTLSIAGRADKARIVSSGAGTVAAGALAAGDLTVNQQGTGTVSIAARYTADVTNAGLGSVTVGGRPKCNLRGAVAGPVSCGAPRP